MQELTYDAVVITHSLPPITEPFPSTTPRQALR